MIKNKLEESLKEMEKTIKSLPDDENKKASIYFIKEMSSPENTDSARVKSLDCILENYRITLFNKDILMYQKFKKTLRYLKEKWVNDEYFTESSPEKRLETAALKGCLVNLDFGNDEIRLNDEVVKLESPHLMIVDGGNSGGVGYFKANRKLPYDACKGVLYTKYKPYNEYESESFYNQVRINLDPIWMKSVVVSEMMNGSKVKCNYNLEPWNEDIGLTLLAKKENKTDQELFELLINEYELSNKEKIYMSSVETEFIHMFKSIEKEAALNIIDKNKDTRVVSHLYNISNNDPDILIHYFESAIKSKSKIHFTSSNFNLEKPSEPIALNKLNKLLVINNPENLKYLNKEEQTKEICLIAVRKNGNTLRYVEKPTKVICETAMRSKETAIKYVPENILNKIKQKKQSSKNKLK